MSIAAEMHISAAMDQFSFFSPVEAELISPEEGFC
jgi:hypothetical protein